MLRECLILRNKHDYQLENYPLSDIVVQRGDNSVYMLFMLIKSTSSTFRMEVDLDRNVLLFLNNSAEHENLPETEKNVRVTEYNSKMIIKPHHSYTEVCLYVSVCQLLLYSLQQLSSSSSSPLSVIYHQYCNKFIGLLESFPNRIHLKEEHIILNAACA